MYVRDPSLVRQLRLSCICVLLACLSSFRKWVYRACVTWQRLRLSIKVGKEYAMDRKQHLRPSGTTAALYGLNSVMALHQVETLTAVQKNDQFTRSINGQ